MDYLLFWLSGLIEPVALVAWGLLGVIFLLRRNNKDRHGYYAGVGILIAYLAVASPLGANLMVGFLEHRTDGAAACATISVRAPVVVLSGGITVGMSTSPDLASLKEETFRRVVEGVRLASSLPGGDLILSGGGWELPKEADVMEALVVALGFPSARVIKEDHSTSTFQNGVEVTMILRQKKINEIRLVTSAMHMRRAAAVFRKQGVSVCPVPVDEKWIQPRLVDALVPQTSALTKSTDAVHEILGYLWYSLSGKL
jgi:uncharacterized SAM-binding protein YcdF (DUF218 family)